jgi:(p)ppGpp synthase/HD superfamily hydrolase
MKNEEFRLKIEFYQEELAPVATQVFMRVVGLRSSQVIPTEDPRILAIAEQIDTLTEITTFLREHMQAMLEAQGHVSMQLEQAVRLLEALTSRQEATETQLARIDERTQRLSPAHTREVQFLVERIARALERQSAATTLKLAHALIYGRLKTRFQAGSYKEIPDERFEEVMNYLHEELRRVTGGTAPEQGSLF